MPSSAHAPLPAATEPLSPGADVRDAGTATAPGTVLSAPAVPDAWRLSELLHARNRGLVEIVAARRSAAGRLVEFRRGGFVRVGRCGEFLRLLHSLRGPRTELFFTPATFEAPISGNEGVGSLTVAWVDIDDPAGLVDLRRFPHRPHAMVASGSGGVHAYWLLRERLSPEAGESVNRRLAGALGGDPASFNRGRLLRVPGSVNHKASSPRGLPARCRLVSLDSFAPPHSVDRLTAGLTDPRPDRPPRVDGDDEATGPFDRLEAWDYYRALTSLEPARDGAIRCPNAHHEDRHPSARLYRGAGRGWFCFACGAGGGAVDMVAALRGLPTGRALRGARFRECAVELREVIGR